MAESHQIQDNEDGFKTCPLCEEKSTTQWQESVYSYGQGDTVINIPVKLPVRVCEACDFEYLDQAAERLRHEALCQHFGVLTPWEIRAIRKSHGMTRAQFAKMVEADEAEIGRWERGVGIQSHASDHTLRTLKMRDAESLPAI